MTADGPITIAELHAQLTARYAVEHERLRDRLANVRADDEEERDEDDG